MLEGGRGYRRYIITHPCTRAFIYLLVSSEKKKEERSDQEMTEIAGQECARDDWTEEVAETTETKDMESTIVPTTPQAKTSWLRRCSRILTFSPVKKVEETSSSSKGSVQEVNTIFEGSALSDNLEGQKEKASPQKRRRGRGRSVRRTKLVVDVMEQDIKDSRGKKRMLEVTTVEETGKKYKKSHTVGLMVQTPGERRYNLRHTTIAASKASKQVSKGVNKCKPAAVEELKSTLEDGEPNIEANKASAAKLVTPTPSEEESEEEEEEAEEATTSMLKKVLNFLMR